MFHTLESGLDKIWEEDSKTQLHYFDVICKELRGCDLPILRDLKAFFVPDRKYMIEFFGQKIVSPQFDCYDYKGACKWVGHLVVPIRNVKGKLVGFTGYNPFTKFADNEEEFKEMARYKESSVQIMDKSKYFMCPLGYEKALDDGYIIIVDGFFDCLSIANQSYNSMAILGSMLSKEVQFYLGFIDKVYIAGDNDVAGSKLIKKLKMVHPKVFPIVQGKYKDIDEFIKKHPKEFNQSMSAIFNKIPTPILLKA